MMAGWGGLDPLLRALRAVAILAMLGLLAALILSVVPTTPYVDPTGRNDARVTQAAVEVLVAPTTVPTRATVVGTEVIYQGDAAVRATVVGVEVIYVEAPRPRAAWATFIE